MSRSFVSESDVVSSVHVLPRGSQWRQAACASPFAGGGRFSRFAADFEALAEHRFEFPEKFGHILSADDERRKQPQDMIVRAVDQQAAAKRFLDKGRAFDREIDAEDQAFAANFADEIEARGELFKSGAEFGAARANVGEQIFLFDHGEKFESGGADERTAAERRAVHSRARKREANFSLAMNAPSGRPPASGFATVTISGSDSNF